MQRHASNLSADEPWNRIDLRAPPRCAVNSQLTPLDVQIIQEMRLVLTEAVSALTRLKVFRTEAALLSKFLYRFKRAFRQDKGVQNLVKINQAFRRYDSIKIEEVFSHFVDFVPFNITWSSLEAYLPTRQMLKWVLLRILTVSKILSRIMHLSKEAGKYLFGRLHLGWSAHYMIFGLAVTGRIRTCAKYALLLASNWYTRLLGYMDVLPETAKFLPGFKFPRNLEDFVGDAHLNRPSKKDMDTVFELIDLTKDDFKDNRQKKDMEDDDVIITNEVFRTIVPKEGPQTGQKVVIEEIRTNYNFADEEMAIVFERRKVVQPSGNGPPSVISQTTSISHSSSKQKSRQSTAGPSTSGGSTSAPSPAYMSTTYIPSARRTNPGAARGTTYRLALNRASAYRATVSRGSAYRTLLSRGSAYRKVLTRSAKCRAARARAVRARATRARAARILAPSNRGQGELQSPFIRGEPFGEQENFPAHA